MQLLSRGGLSIGIAEGKHGRVQLGLNIKCTHFLNSLFLSIDLESIITQIKQK